MKDAIEIYTHSVVYALEHGEIEQYRLSHNANVDCKEAIEQAIADHYRANRLGSGAVHQVVEQFGYDRVFLVLEIRSGRRNGMDEFPTVTKSGQKPFQFLRIKTASEETETESLLWTAAIKG